MKYRVKFEMFGKKMQTDVEADNEYHAKEQVRERLNFVSVRLAEVPFEWDILTELNKIMGKK